MNASLRNSRPPTQASPPRRVFHTLVAIAGWVLFVYWWWLVFRRVSESEMRFTLFFISIALIIIVLLTVIWALHNASIYRSRGPRTKVRTVPPDFSHDRIGREVQFPTMPNACLNSAVVRVRIQDGAKVYAAGSAADIGPAPARRSPW